MEEQKAKKIIKICVAIVIIILLITIILLILLKYNIEGERNLLFSINKIVIISSAEGVSKEGSTAVWDLDIMQNNDIYIYITKNQDINQQDAIRSIKLEKFNIINNPKKGNIKIYKPSNVNNILFKNLPEYEINNVLEYKGDIDENIENLKISNQGGIIYLRYSLEGLGEYTSNETQEIKHDGSIIKHTETTYEEILHKVAFDLTIELESKKSYKATIEIDLPASNILEEGTSSIEDNELKNIVFKRI